MNFRFLAVLLLLVSPALAQNPTAQFSQLAITGGLKTEGIPVSKFADTFNSPTTLDTTNNWSAPTQSGTGTATYTQGQEILNSGTTTGSYALLTSQTTFAINSPAYLIYRGAFNSGAGSGLPAEVPTNCKQMGFFIAAVTPTCAAPVTDGILFEITSTTTPSGVAAGGLAGAGKLQAVTYASGSRTLLADLSVPVSGISYQPVFAPDGSLVCPGRNTPQALSDTCPHILDIWFNGNSAEFDVDGKPVAFMLSGSLGPNNNGLPWSSMIINGGGTTASQLKINQASVGDEGRNSNKVCDPVSPWRCVTVNASGQLLSSSSPAVGITPTDRTITSASGSSQQIMAANAARHSLTIENTGNANCGVNPTGGTAAIGGAGTITLAPLGSYTPAIPTLSAVTVICTSGQPVYGNES
jgi:hypothetical protein